MNAYEELKQYLREAPACSVPSEEYIHRSNLAEKYSKLGFESKASRIKEEIKKIRPLPQGNFLWINLNLEKLWINRRGNDFYGVLFDHTKVERKALVLVPCERWLGDVPEEVLNHALMTKHNFQSLYVAPVISGHRDEKDSDIDLITPDLRSVVESRLDPLLLGSLRRDIERKGPANFAVLGVWGTDWFELKLP